MAYFTPQSILVDWLFLRNNSLLLSPPEKHELLIHQLSGDMILVIIRSLRLPSPHGFRTWNVLHHFEARFSFLWF